MADWTPTRLADCARFISGGTPAKGNPRYWGGDIPWLSAKDMKSLRIARTHLTVTSDGAANGTRLVPTGAVLVLVRGMTLHQRVPICYAERPITFNQDVKALLPKGEVVDGEFLAYALTAQEQALLRLVDSASHGTGRIHTHLLEDFRISLPPLAEQREIATTLRLFDRLLEDNGRLQVALASSAALICSRAMETSSKTVALREIAEITKGVSYRSAELSPSKTALVSLKCFGRHGGFQEQGLKPYTGRFKPSQRLAVGDAVVAMTDITQDADVVGRVVRVPAHTGFEGLVGSVDTAVLRPRNSRLSPEVLLGVLSTAVFREHCRARANGTTVLHLPPRAVGDFPVATPSRVALEEATALVRPLWRQYDAIAAEQRALDAMQKWLLSLLTRGQARVAERRVAA